ncbi:MAG: hypothetical protein LAT52_10185 [Balneolales bacterium]|nr:hypothetical protein [Balneolales bacterium]
MVSIHTEWKFMQVGWQDFNLVCTMLEAERVNSETARLTHTGKRVRRQHVRGVQRQYLREVQRQHVSEVQRQHLREVQLQYLREAPRRERHHPRETKAVISSATSSVER